MSGRDEIMNELGTLRDLGLLKKPAAKKTRKRRTARDRARRFSEQFLWHMSTVSREDARTLMRIAWLAGFRSARRK